MTTTHPRRATYTEQPIINGRANLNYTFADFEKLPLDKKGAFLWYAIVQKGLQEKIPYSEITAATVETPELFYKVMRTAAEPGSTYKPRKMKIETVEISSAAQLMTLAGYDTQFSKEAKIPFRNLRFRTEAADMDDLKKCVRLIDGYNDFLPIDVNSALTKYLHLPQFYGESNPNNGNSYIKFDIGREGSPVMYIKFHAHMGFDSTIKVITGREGATVEVCEYTLNEFKEELKHRVQMFAKASAASECTIAADEVNDLYKLHLLEFRVWWD